MSLIDQTYFTNKNGIYIPSVSNANPQNLTALTNLIEVREKEYLINSLGYALYKEFTDALAGVPAAKWAELRDGKTYTKSINGVDMNVRWNGLINTEKKSAIAFYTYFYWVRQSNSDLSLTGMVQNKNENSDRGDIHQKSVAAWNNYVSLTDNNTTERGLYQFICDMNEETEDTYPNWVYTELEYINQFGL